jgi:hypothetical protein
MARKASQRGENASQTGASNSRKRSPSVELVEVDGLPPKRAIRPSTKALLNQMDAVMKPTLDKFHEEYNRKRRKPAEPEKRTLEPDPATDTTTDEDDVDVPLDTSNMTFTLSFMVFLADTLIYSRPDKFKLDEASYSSFKREATEKVEKKSMGCEFESSTAILMAKRVTKNNHLVFNVDRQVDWDRVESFVDEWMIDSKEDIMVKLTFIFNKSKPDGTEEGKEKEKESRKV